MTTIINAKVGLARGGVSRVWLEGQKLLHAGLRIGTRYALKSDEASKRVELVALEDSSTVKTKGVFTVSRRERNGIVTPVLEVRSELFAKFFKGLEKVRVAIRAGRILITARQIDVKIRERVERIQRKLADRQRLATGSLFHGTGILDKALHRGLIAVGVAAFIQVGVEQEGTFLDASLRNNPELWSEESVAINSDIRDLYLAGAMPLLDIVWGGVPCVSASLAGRAKNKLEFAEEHSTAGTLFFDLLECVKASNPAVVLLENVKPYASTAGMAVIRSVLDSLGYLVFETVLSGGQFGAIEDRHRLVMVAVTKGLGSGEFLFPNTHPSVADRGMESLGNVLQDIPLDSPRWKPYEYLVAKEKRDIEDGKFFRRQLVTAESTSIGCCGKGYGKARTTEPHLKHPHNPLLSRLLTPVEHARVKTIPEEVIAGLSETVAHEALGQSVVFNKLEAVGVALGSYLQGHPIPATFYDPQIMVAAALEEVDESDLVEQVRSPIQMDLLAA